MSADIGPRNSLPPWLAPLATRVGDGIADGRLGHAPLIHGPAGVGKRLLADWLVARLLCLETPDRAPCGQCRSCTLRAAGTHPDCFPMGIEEDRTGILVEQVRDLTAGLALTPALGEVRAGCIDPADAMTEGAANALLKTLEEPAGNVWLILVSDRPDRLPATIRSRCQALPVRIPEPGIAAEWLAGQAPDTDADHRARALELAGGAPLTARDWLQSGELDRGLAIRDQLLAQASGGDPPDLESWLEQPDSTWYWLAQWTATFLRRCLARNQRRTLPGSGRAGAVLAGGPAGSAPGRHTGTPGPAFSPLAATMA